MGEKRFKNIINVANSGRYVLISTVLTFDAGWETMVFDCDRYGNIVSHTDLDVRRYSDDLEAEAGHKEMCEKWGKLAVEEYEKICEEVEYGI